MDVLPVVVLVALGILAAILLSRLVPRGRRRVELEDELSRPGAPTLDYVVPAGQDPVVLLTALSSAGYPAVTDPEDSDLMHIACPSGRDRDREHVRATIARVHTTALDAGVPMEPADVRFVGEG